MTEEEIRASIVEEAISWTGTPYHPFARVKGHGVDCAQLPAAVYCACDIIPDIRPEYSQQWMMHRDEELYLEEIRKWARDIPFDEIQAGDLCVWKFGRTYSHSAIVIEPPIVIHAVMNAGAVVQADIEMDVDLKDRPRLAFSVFDKDGQLLKRKGA